MSVIDNIAPFTFVLMRMSGCIFLNPIIGRKNLPAILKAGLALLLTLTVLSFTSQPPPIVQMPVEYAVLLLRELAIGFSIGFIITLFNYIITLGGEIADLQMGISMTKIYDPQSNISMSVSAVFYNILYMFLFLAADGHITLIRLFLLSGEIMPYGQLAIQAELSAAILSLFCQCTMLAVKLALPIIAIEVLVEVGVGILMKAIPQINVFVINIQAKLLLGLVTTAALFAPLAGFFERLVTLLFDSIEAVIILM